jgi:hypothetical protein
MFSEFIDIGFIADHIQSVSPQYFFIGLEVAD